MEGNGYVTGADCPGYLAGAPSDGLPEGYTGKTRCCLTLIWHRPLKLMLTACVMAGTP